MPYRRADGPGISPRRPESPYCGERKGLVLPHARAMTWVVTTILFIQAFATAQAQVQTLTCPAPGGFGVAGQPIAAPVLLSSLKTVPNPVLPNGPSGIPRDDLLPFILNVPAAIQLGKALFWDMQAGSDNKIA